MKKREAQYICDTFRVKKKFVEKNSKNDKNFEFLNFEIPPKIQFSTFSDFLFPNPLLACIFSFSKVGLTKTCFLLFNTVKTAKTAEFTRKTRISRKMQGKKIFRPQIRNQRSKTIQNQFSNLLEQNMTFFLLHCVMSLFAF